MTGKAPSPPQSQSQSQTHARAAARAKAQQLKADIAVWRGHRLGAFRQLDARKIVETVGELRLRIGHRFPDTSLVRIAGEVESFAAQAAQRAAWCAAPQWGIRLLVLGVTAVGLFLLLRLSMGLRLTPGPELHEVPQLLELAYTAANDLALVAVALIFIWGWETRIKRARAVAALHELRALAHIIDMHQLTKYPESLLREPAEAGQRTMTREALHHYLQYCSDLLALLGKVAALFAQTSSDAAVLAAVSELENLTAVLEHRIWQKITLIGPLRLTTPSRLHGADVLP